MTKRLLVPGLGLALLLLGLVALRCGNSMTGQGPSAASNSSASDPEDVPLFPGTEVITDVGRIFAGDWRRFGYETYANAQELATFYKNEMPKRGWTLQYENNNMSPDVLLGFYWTDSTETQAWDLNSTIDIRTGLTSTERRDLQISPIPRRVYVEVSLSRLPKGDKVPLYPGAEQIEVKVDCRGPAEATEFGPLTRRRCTTYLTTATPDEVQEYYTANLEQDGWSLYEDKEDVAGIRNMRFGWYSRAVGGAVLDIRIEKSSTGKTRVIMALDGRTDRRERKENTQSRATSF